MKEEKVQSGIPKKVLTAEQEDILDLYIRNLNAFYTNIRESEKIELEIETLHLKKILTK